MITLGQRIKRLRISLALTQQELGRMVGVEKAAINKYEAGRVVNLKQETIRRLAKALHTTPEYILGYSDREESFYSDFDAVLLEAYHDSSPSIQKAIRLLLDLEVEA